MDQQQEAAASAAAAAKDSSRSSSSGRLSNQHGPGAAPRPSGKKPRCCAPARTPATAATAAAEEEAVKGAARAARAAAAAAVAAARAARHTITLPLNPSGSSLLPRDFCLPAAAGVSLAATERKEAAQRLWSVPTHRSFGDSGEKTATPAAAKRQKQQQQQQANARVAGIG
ncbi:hypothetical protein ACSSS7_004601 [Eimeria intestinalis]